MWLSWFMSPSDIGFPLYATRINVLDSLKGFSSSQYEHVDTSHIHRCETFPVCHNAPNTKLCRIFAVKMGASPLPYSHVESLVRIAFGVLLCIWGEALLDFCHENKGKCYRIFTMEIWHWLQTHLESIDQVHTYSETKPQSPTHLKPWKLMPIACFQLQMSKNYAFTKTENHLWAGIVGCLTPSPQVTRLPNSRIRFFTHPY